MSKPTPESTKCICCTYQDGVSYSFCYQHRFFERIRSPTLCIADSYRIECFIESFSILSHTNSIGRRTKDSYPVASKSSSFFECESTVQSGLSSECEHNTIRTFFLYDALDILRSHRNKVESICEAGIRLNRSNIRIHEDGLDTRFFQSFDRLTPRVVEFSGFTDLQGSRAEDEDLFVHKKSDIMRVKLKKMGNGNTSLKLYASYIECGEENSIPQL
mgnify:CR=1 FL=1